MSDLEVEQGFSPAEPAEPEAPAEPSWSGPSQEEWQAYQEQVAYIAQSQQAPPQYDPQQGPQTQAEIDFFADNAQEQLDAYIESKLAPYADYTQQAILSEAEERAQDIIGSIVSRDGEFLMDGSAEKVRLLANSYVPQMAAQYGYGPAAAEHALEQAAKDVREWEQAVGKAYHDQQMNQLSTLGGAPRQPTINGEAAQQQVFPGGGDELDVVARWFGSQK